MTKDELRDIYEQNMITEKELIERGLEGDYCVTINTVASVLGFSQENVQSNVLPYLMKCRAGRYIKSYMQNNRLKIVVSKSSLCEYICSSLTVQEAYQTYGYPDDSSFIEKIGEALGNKKKIQPYLNYAADKLNQCFKITDEYKQNELEIINKRISRVEEGTVNVIDFIGAKSFDASVIVKYYRDIKAQLSSDDNYDADDINSVYSIFEKDMYSLKQIKEKLGFRHTQQAYRFLDRVPHVAIKIADALPASIDRKKGDRNTRYIINNKSFKLIDGQYYIRLNAGAQGHIESMIELDAFAESSFNDVLEQYIFNYIDEFKKLQMEERERKEKDKVEKV